jgi:Flp pilus assembly protein TadD
MPKDLFISYSRADNQSGRVTELKEQIEKDYLRHTGENIDIFFDMKDINSMDDWRNRILEGLRESRILLLILSPHYLKSDYCEWEITEFLKYEYSRLVQGEGVAQVYFVEIPGLDTPEFHRECAQWVAKVRQRNHVDLRPWYEEGAESITKDDIKRRLEDLERSIETRLSRLRKISKAPGNLPPHNPRFVGRIEEMERLHKATALGRFGCLTAVQGMGGLGKTTLAIQYAHAYTDYFSGGRWLVNCAGVETLAKAIRSLASELGVYFTDEEKADDQLAARRILSVLLQKAELTLNGINQISQEQIPKVLLILDNIENPALFKTPETDLLTNKPWLSVLATTRLSPDFFGAESEERYFISVDELSQDDALALIESYQQRKQFSRPAEREAAAAIVRLLGGFTLAVEIAAIYLSENRASVTAANLLKRLEKEGIDTLGLKIQGGIRHPERMVSACIKPALNSLSKLEKSIVLAAALLPPDHIPLPWIRDLISKAEGLGYLLEDAKPGYPDPWLILVNHLIGLRLIQPVEWGIDEKPRLCRMHRLVQSVFQKEFLGEKSQDSFDSLRLIKQRFVTGLLEYAHHRTEFLDKDEGWLYSENRWEIEPLAFLIRDLVQNKPKKSVSNMAASLGNIYKAIGEYQKARDYYSYQYRIVQENMASKGSELLESLLNLAEIYIDLGDYTRAQSYLNQAEQNRTLEIDEMHPSSLRMMSIAADILYYQGDYTQSQSLSEKSYELHKQLDGEYHSKTMDSLSGLAVGYDALGDYSRAQPLYEKAYKLRKKVLGPEHPDTLTSMNNLGHFYRQIADYTRAQPLQEKAYELRKKVLGPEHPDTLTSLSGLAVLYEAMGDYVRAQHLYESSFEIRTRILGADHPDTLSSMNNLAVLYKLQGDYPRALSLYERSYKLCKKVLGDAHPDTLTCMNNLARLYESLGDYSRAQVLYEQSYQLRQKVFEPTHPKILASINNLARICEIQKNYSRAQQLYEEAFELARQILGDEHPDTLTYMNNLSLIYKTQGNYTHAQQLYENAYFVRLRKLGEVHPETLISMNNLALLYKSQGDYARAQPLLEKAYELRQKVLGPEHPDTLNSMNNLAGLYQSQGDYARAEALYREALSAARRLLGINHPKTKKIQNNLEALGSMRSEKNHNEEVP